jgi:hypothetical protein
VKLADQVRKLHCYLPSFNPILDTRLPGFQAYCPTVCAKVAVYSHIR